MLNVLGLEPWVIAEQLRHSDGGALLLELYGHPERDEAIRGIRVAYRTEEPRGERSTAPPNRKGRFGGS